MRLESFNRYYRLHDDFSNIVKISAASYDTLQRLVNTTNGGWILGSLIDSTNNPWGKKKNYPRYNEQISDSKKGITNMLVVNAMTNFEEFAKHIYVDIAQFTDTQLILHGIPITSSPTFDPNHPPEYDQDLHDKISDYLWRIKPKNYIDHFHGIVGATSSVISKILPLYHYLRASRNCIAHSNGLPNAEYIQITTDPSLQQSFSDWNTLCRRPAHPLKIFPRGSRIQFESVDAILASAVCRLIAAEMNELATKLFTDHNVIMMATYYGIMVDQHYYRMKTNSIQTLVSNYVHNYYGRRSIKAHVILAYLKTTSHWTDLNTRFAML